MAQAARLREEASGPGLPVPGFLQRIVEYPRRVRQFLHEVRVEMKQVNWPSWDDVKSTTTVVIVTVAFFAVYFLLTDTFFSRLESMVWQRFKH
jgi:preprotein translocase subunit SecE